MEKLDFISKMTVFLKFSKNLLSYFTCIEHYKTKEEITQIDLA